MKLYGDPTSGNVWKVQYLLDRLGIPYELDPVSWKNDGTRSPAFTRINPNQRVPAIDDDGFVLWESGAILCYLAEGTPWIPEDRRDRARMLQWMFFEQYSHEPFIAVSRFIAHNVADPAERAQRLAEKRKGSEHALRVMDLHLAGRQWFVGDAPSLADIALVAYTHVAPEAGFDLGAYPHVEAWVDRFRVLPGWLDLPPYELAA